MHKILIYSGTARTNSYTPHVAQFVFETVTKNSDVTAEIVSPQSLQLNFNDEGTDAPGYDELRQKVAAADAFIVVTPEYNHGYSASTKYMLDLCLKQYIHKPVAFVGVSSHVTGGARAIEALVMSVRELGLVACFNDVNVGNVKDEVVDGKFVDPAKWEKRVNRLLEELLWMSATLRYDRENFSKEAT